MWQSFKEWIATKPWTRIIPFAPALSFGKANEFYEETKEKTIGVIKKLSLPMFLLIVILILVLIFWNKIASLFGIK